MICWLIPIIAGIGSALIGGLIGWLLAKSKFENLEVEDKRYTQLKLD